MREQPWRPDPGGHGRIVAFSDNPIARAVQAIGTVAGRGVTILGEDESPLDWLRAQDFRPADALVICDHDAPDAPAVLRLGLELPLGYVAMMASRRRSEMVRADLAELPPEQLAKLRVPAGLNIGGKAAGEIALSVVAEIVAAENDRPGMPMRFT